jgi:hypothetical protein
LATRHDLEGAVSAFGKATKSKLANRAVTGAPEDQLRAPLETLMSDLAELAGLPPNAISLVGESTLSHLATRPDYAASTAYLTKGGGLTKLALRGKSYSGPRINCSSAVASG